MTLPPKIDRLVAVILVVATCFLSFFLMGWFMPDMWYRLRMEVGQKPEEVYRRLIQIYPTPWRSFVDSTISGETDGQFRWLLKSGEEWATIDHEVFQQIPGKSYVVFMSNEKILGTGTFTFIGHGDSTRVEYLNKIRGRDWILRSIYSWKFSGLKEEHIKDFERLRQRIEGLTDDD